MKYLIEFPKQKASALLEYNDLGLLIQYELSPGEFKEEQYQFLFDKFPFTTKNLESWIVNKDKLGNLNIKKVEQDLTFENFYALYDMKYGKKPRSKAIWETLTNEDRVKAIAFIPRYNKHLADTGTGKKYPETYLNQQIWNN